ncbi:gamma-glutamyltransferase, partial [Candidatus Bathyarchaeota archaeon]|nr:gamma-glutamyltransferase [Candidatus Bathyarchaeota archaeon]
MCNVTPGTIAGLTETLDRYGTLSLKEVIEPAAKVAEEGFVAGWAVAAAIMRRMKAFSQFPEWKRIYMQEGEWPYLPYSTAMAKPQLLVNKDLAKSLRAIVKEGAEVFYKGWIAEEITKELEQGGG